LTLHAWWSTIPAASAYTSHRTQYFWISVIQQWPPGSDSTVQSLTQQCYAWYMVHIQQGKSPYCTPFNNL
jgi:hypothetical protein